MTFFSKAIVIQKFIETFVIFSKYYVIKNIISDVWRKLSFQFYLSLINVLFSKYHCVVNIVIIIVMVSANTYILLTLFVRLV